MNEQDFKSIFNEVEQVYKNYENLSKDFKDDLDERLNTKEPKELNFHNFCLKNFNQIDESLLRLDENISSSNALFKSDFVKLDNKIQQAFIALSNFTNSLSLKEQNIKLLSKIIDTQNERIASLEEQVKQLLKEQK